VHDLHLASGELSCILGLPEDAELQIVPAVIAEYVRIVSMIEHAIDSEAPDGAELPCDRGPSLLDRDIELE
jgi:hypothetical protein